MYVGMYVCIPILRGTTSSGGVFCSYSKIVYYKLTLFANFECHYIIYVTIYLFTLTQEHSDSNKRHIYLTISSAFVLVSIVICNNAS